MKSWSGALLFVGVMGAGFWLGWQAKPKYQMAAAERMVYRIDVRTGEVDFQHLEVPGSGWVRLHPTAHALPKREK